MPENPANPSENNPSKFPTVGAYKFSLDTVLTDLEAAKICLILLLPDKVMITREQAERLDAAMRHFERIE